MFSGRNHSKKCWLKVAFRLFLAGLVSVGVPVMADGPVEIRANDVTLAGSGILSGTVLDTSAKPVSEIRVNILHGDRVVASSISDADGRFAVRGLRNGVHVVQIGEKQHPVRFWNAAAAPPSSVSQMSVVVDEQTVRGQANIFPQSRIVNSLSSSTGTLLLLGAAVGVTLGTTLSSDNDSGAPPASP